jgi:hypothetical protein
MRSGAFQAGLLLAVLIMGTFVALEGENVAKEMGLVEGDPVLVFVVPLPKSARQIRGAVANDRVVWEGEAGFALAGERIVTPSLDRAGEVIKGAGWIDRPIQIVTLDADPGDDTGQDLSDPASREARLERLRELVHKPMLNRGEQMFILQAMSEGIEI